MRHQQGRHNRGLRCRIRRRVSLSRGRRAPVANSGFAAPLRLIARLPRWLVVELIPAAGSIFHPRADTGDVLKNVGQTISLTWSERPKVGHNRLGVGARHVKMRHGVSKGLASDPDSSSQERNHSGIGGRWGSCEPRRHDRPILRRMSRQVRNRRSGKPAGTIQATVRFTGSMTGAAHSHILDDIPTA